MIKQETQNSFSDGLIMDLNPLVAKNDSLVNALNATLITVNGNELSLQNDMGNGRVETAYLPEGYVPLGTCSLGGIIYIVSYNPLNNKCLIGSFPSPERNIESSKLNDAEQSLSNEDFKDSTGEVVKYYLTKELNSGMTFSPGDKFMVYGDTIGDIYNESNEYLRLGNYLKFYKESEYYVKKEDESEDDYKSRLKLLQLQTIKLDIGTITESGKLIKFSDLKNYDIKYRTDPENLLTETKNKYHINHGTVNSLDNPPNVDNWRNLVSQPFNIFNSKQSGRLVLIAELIQFNNFDVSVSHKFDKNNNDVKIYNPTFNFNLSGDYPFIPYGIHCNFIIKKEDGTEITLTVQDHIFNNLKFDSFTQYLSLSINFPELGNAIRNAIKDDKYFDKLKKEQITLHYEFIPLMNWGKLNILKTVGQIDLSKLGSGYIGLTSWKYYNDENKNTLVWGLEIYEQPDEKVIGVKIQSLLITKENHTDITDDYFNSSSEITEKAIEIIKPNYSSYFGTFIELNNFNDENSFKPHSLYLNKIVVNTTKKSETFYRWMYTNDIFNEYYYSEEDDYNKLNLKFTPTVNCKFDDSELKTIFLSDIINIPEDYDKSTNKNKCFLKINQNGNIKLFENFHIHNDFIWKNLIVNRTLTSNGNSNHGYQTDGDFTITDLDLTYINSKNNLYSKDNDENWKNVNYTNKNNWTDSINIFNPNYDYYAKFTLSQDDNNSPIIDVKLTFNIKAILQYGDSKIDYSGYFRPLIINNNYDIFNTNPLRIGYGLIKSGNSVALSACWDPTVIVIKNEVFKYQQMLRNKDKDSDNYNYGIKDPSPFKIHDVYPYFPYANTSKVVWHPAGNIDFNTNEVKNKVNAHLNSDCNFMIYNFDSKNSYKNSNGGKLQYEHELCGKKNVEPFTKYGIYERWIQVRPNTVKGYLKELPNVASVVLYDTHSEGSPEKQLYFIGIKNENGNYIPISLCYNDVNIMIDDFKKFLKSIYIYTKENPFNKIEQQFKTEKQSDNKFPEALIICINNEYQTNLNLEYKFGNFESNYIPDIQLKYINDVINLSDIKIYTKDKEGNRVENKNVIKSNILSSINNNIVNIPTYSYYILLDNEHISKFKNALLDKIGYSGNAICVEINKELLIVATESKLDNVNTTKLYKLNEKTTLSNFNNNGSITYNPGTIINTSKSFEINKDYTTTKTEYNMELDKDLNKYLIVENSNSIVLKNNLDLKTWYTQMYINDWGAGDTDPRLINIWSKIRLGQLISIFDFYFNK